MAMEPLLSSSFDLLSSYDTNCIRKGLKHLEGFVAKMCLQTSPSATPRAGARRGDVIPTPAAAVASRPRDAAFREFLRLQNGFEWNGTLYLHLHTDAASSHWCDHELASDSQQQQSPSDSSHAWNAY
jgi:hypothetical protein